MDVLPLHQTNPWLIYPFVVAAVLLAIVLAHARGSAARRRAGGRSAYDMSTARGALIGLLSLMIGFSFNVTMNNFQARREALVNLASAVSMVRDRINLLPPSQAVAARASLDALVDVQIAMGAGGEKEFQSTAKRSVALREALLQKVSGSDDVGGELLKSVTLLGTQLRARIAAEENQAPAVLLITLYSLTLAAWCFISYASALEGQDNRIINGLMAAVFATVVAVIADIDRPHTGLVVVDQKPLLALKTPPASP